MNITHPQAKDRSDLSTSEDGQERNKACRRLDRRHLLAVVEALRPRDGREKGECLRLDLKGDGELLNNGVWTEGELRTCPSTDTSAMVR